MGATKCAQYRHANWNVDAGACASYIVTNSEKHLAHIQWYGPVDGLWLAPCILLNSRAQ